MKVEKTSRINRLGVMESYRLVSFIEKNREVITNSNKPVGEWVKLAISELGFNISHSNFTHFIRLAGIRKRKGYPTSDSKMTEILKAMAKILVTVLEGLDTTDSPEYKVVKQFCVEE